MHCLLHMSLSHVPLSLFLAFSTPGLPHHTRSWNDLCIVFLCVSFIRLPMYTAFGAPKLWSVFLTTDLYFLLDNALALNTAFWSKGVLITDRR